MLLSDVKSNDTKCTSNALYGAMDNNHSLRMNEVFLDHNFALVRLHVYWPTEIKLYWPTDNLG